MHVALPQLFADDDEGQPSEIGGLLAHLNAVYGFALFVLEVAGTVAGFTTVFARVPFERLDERPGDYALVAELLVRRAYRRRGYARVLLDCGQRYAASQGAIELRIGVLADNTAARTLYLDFGFRPYIETLSKSPSPPGTSRRTARP